MSLKLKNINFRKLKISIINSLVGCFTLVFKEK